MFSLCSLPLCGIRPSYFPWRLCRTFIMPLCGIHHSFLVSPSSCFSLRLTRSSNCHCVVFVLRIFPATVSYALLPLCYSPFLTCFTLRLSRMFSLRLIATVWYFHFFLFFLANESYVFVASNCYCAVFVPSYVFVASNCHCVVRPFLFFLATEPYVFSLRLPTFVVFVMPSRFTCTFDCAVFLPIRLFGASVCATYVIWFLLSLCGIRPSHFVVASLCHFVFLLFLCDGATVECFFIEKTIMLKWVIRIPKLSWIMSCPGHWVVLN